MSRIQQMIEDEHARNAEAPQASPVYITGSAGEEPLTWSERLHITQQDIVEAEKLLKAKAWQAGSAKLEALNDYQVALADALLALRGEEGAQNPVPARIAKRQAKVDRIKATWDANNAKLAAEDATKPGDKLEQIEIDVKAIQRRGEPIVPFNIVVEVTPGKTIPDETAERVTRFRAKHEERAATLRLPRTEAEISEELGLGIERYGSDVAAKARNVSRVSWIADRSGRGGKIEGRKFSFPTTTIVSGNALATLGNAQAAMVTLFADELHAKLLALALEGHDESRAISMGDRVAKLAAIDAEILQIEREHEAFVRLARSENVNPGPRISNDIRALLDIK